MYFPPAVENQETARQHQEPARNFAHIRQHFSHGCGDLVAPQGSGESQNHHDEAHAAGVGEKNQRPFPQIAALKRTHDRGEKQRSGATQRNHRKRNAEQENRRQLPARPALVQTRNQQLGLVAEQHGDAQRHHEYPDYESRPAQPALYRPLADDRGSQKPDCAEEQNESDSQSETHHKTPENISADIRFFARLQAHEVRQVGRQHGEPARVERRHQPYGKSRAQDTAKS